jgi:hypothetical protein
MLKLFNNLLLSGIALVSGLALNSQAQGIITLNAGDSWTYHFTNLDFVETRFGSPFGPAALSGGSFSIGYSVTGENSEYLCELFEGQAPDSLLYSFSQPIAGVFLLPNSWNDLEGSIRFNVLSGSYSIERLSFFVYRPVSLSRYDVFASTVSAVPEPITCSLLLVGMGAIWYARRR